METYPLGEGREGGERNIPGLPSPDETMIIQVPFISLSAGFSILLTSTGDLSPLLPHALHFLLFILLPPWELS